MIQCGGRGVENIAREKKKKFARSTLCSNIQSAVHHLGLLCSQGDYASAGLFRRLGLSAPISSSLARFLVSVTSSGAFPLIGASLSGGVVETDSAGVSSSNAGVVLGELTKGVGSPGGVVDSIIGVLDSFFGFLEGFLRRSRSFVQ